MSNQASSSAWMPGSIMQNRQASSSAWDVPDQLHPMRVSLAWHMPYESGGHCMWKQAAVHGCLVPSCRSPSGSA
jgi:hypothetical protein